MHRKNYMIIFLNILLKILIVKSQLNTFKHCLRVSQSPSLLGCAGQQAIVSLSSLDTMDNFTITKGLTAIKDETVASRSIPSFIDQDPMDFRGILENAGAVFGQRSLRWDMGKLYPGLSLRIGPAADSNSVLEFIMDQQQSQADERLYLGDEPSTARIVAKKFLLPFLLGLKFNLVALVPLFFGIIVLLCKKAAFLAKIALYITGLFGLGGAFSLGSLTGFGHDGYGYGYGHSKPPLGGIGLGLGGFGDHHHHHHDQGYLRNDRRVNFEQPREDMLPTPTPDRFYNFEKNILKQDRKSKLFEKEIEEDLKEDSTDDNKSYRNFGWKTL